MIDGITLICLAGFFVSLGLWKYAPAKELYRDQDNEPVSLKSIFGFIWVTCLVALIYQQFKFLTG